MQNLCDPRRIKVEKDLLEELGRLPKTLKELYDRTYEKVLQSADFSRSVGIRLLQWLLVAQRRLAISEIIAAVSPVEDGISMTLTPRDVLNMTCNLVVEDKALGCFRFAHLSVREYLDTRPEFSNDETHRLLAERCLDHYILGYLNDPLDSYSAFFWPTHYASLGRHARSIVLNAKLRYLLFHGVNASGPFRHWRHDINSKVAQFIDRSFPQWRYYLAGAFDGEHDHRYKLCAAVNPFLTACIYDLPEVLQMQAESYIESFQSLLYRYVRVPEYYGLSGLHIAIISNSVGVAKMLLRNGCKTSYCTILGETPLYTAARCQNIAMIRLLLGYHANPNEINHLYRVDASTEFFEEVRDDILDRRTARVDPSFDSSLFVQLIDAPKEAPIHLIARLGDSSCLAELLQYGADVNAETESGLNALYYAILGACSRPPPPSLQRHREFVEMLVTAGADVNAPFTYGGLPLHHAATTGRNTMVSLLLRLGADPQKRDSDMRSAFDVAISCRHGIIAAILRPLTILESDLAEPHGRYSLLNPGRPSSLVELRRRYALRDPGQAVSLAEPQRRCTFDDPGQSSSIPIIVTDNTTFDVDLDTERRNDAITLDLAIKANQEELDSESVAVYEETKPGGKAHRIVDKAIAAMSRDFSKSRKDRD